MSAEKAITPRAPASLRAAGRRLWREVVRDFELSPVELERLRLASAQLDLVGALEQELADGGLVSVGSKGQPRLSGAVAELNRARALASRLIADLGLPGAGEEDQNSRSPASRRAQHAANARWVRRPRLVGAEEA